MRDVVDRLQETVGRMAEQMQTLVRLEIQLAKTELAEKAKSAAIGAVFFIAAGVLLFFAVFGLLIAAIWGHRRVPADLAAGALIVMFLFIAIGRPARVHRPAQARRRPRPPSPRRRSSNVQPLPHEIKEAAST